MSNRHASPRVVVAHDWMTQYAGSERVVAALLQLYPGSQLLTSVIDRGNVPEILAGAEASFLQRIPGAVTHHEYFLPLMPLAWMCRRPISDADVVISSSHSCAKAVNIAPGIPHICYCHTPMRYAWSFDDERERFPGVTRPFAALGMKAFKRWDRRQAGDVTTYVANSSAVRDRIWFSYRREAQIVFPPVDTDFFSPEPLRERNGFLYVGRLVAYKRADRAIRAFQGTSHELTIVGVGPQESYLRSMATPNIHLAGKVSGAELRELYRSSVAVVFLGVEDFGIALAEAQACGTPVIAHREGGAADIVIDGVTGLLVDGTDVESVRHALADVHSLGTSPSEISAAAARFSLPSFMAGIRNVVDGVRR